MLRALPFVLLVAACGASTGLPGGTAAPTLVVRGALAPPNRGADGRCAYPGNLSPTMAMSGTYDVAFAATYAPTMLVEVASSDERGARITLSGFDVRVTDINGTPVASFHSDAATIVNAGGGERLTYAAVPSTLVDSATASTVRAQLMPKPGTAILLVQAIATGIDADGNAIASRPVTLPVSACFGCLVVFPPDIDARPNACATPPSPSDGVTQPCAPGEEPVDCRLCYATNSVCRP